jgi:hypothetical protein
MLQINSGKLFTRGTGRTNQLRGVLYANIDLSFGADVVTAAGTLRQTDGGRGSRAIVFEIEERIEAAEIGPGVLASHTIAPFLADFSALATFGLRAIVSPDPQVVAGLVSDAPGLASYDPPRKFTQRYFDERIVLQDGEAESFAALADRLIALERKSFLAAMRAVRTFVSGLHRMRDDLALAYTLFVSAVESLAQQFDGHAPVWQDLDERKRNPVDMALARASKATGAQVREAILGAERGSLARRYRAFALHHVGPDYFRADGLLAGGAVARHELGEALTQAYILRSRYVHNLQALPDAIRLASDAFEVTEIARRPVLTFQGLIRLTRHVILAFIESSLAIAHESYDYNLEQSGVVQVRLAPEYWVGRPLRRASEASERLEGLLEQLVPVLCGQEGATVTDLRPIFGDIARLARSGGARSRTTLLTLYALFAVVLPRSERSRRLDAMLEEYAAEIAGPCGEAVIARSIFGMTEAWPNEVHAAALTQYFAERSRGSGVRAPRLLDAAMCLILAERYRRAMQQEETRAWIGHAVEALPGHAGVRAIEETFAMRRKIDWGKALAFAVTKTRKRAPRKASTSR